MGEVQLLLVGADGRVAAIYTGNEWTVDTVLDDLRAAVRVVAAGIGEQDVDAAVDALTEIAARKSAWTELYLPVPDGSGDWIHRHFRFDPRAVFDLEREVDNWLSRPE